MLALLGGALLALASAPAHVPSSAHAAASDTGVTPHADPAATSVRALRGVDSLVLEKKARRLTLYAHGTPLRSYPVALGFHPEGAKERAGDGRTPEGLYRIDSRNPASRYHRAFHISYPNARDRARAARLGVAPGGAIMIHGLPPRFADYGHDHLQWDWTNGCVAVDDQEIDELWDAVPVGVPIEIKP